MVTVIPLAKQPIVGLSIFYISQPYKKTSFEPESNQRPKDCQLATYSPPLYQLSYRRFTGGGQNLNPAGCGSSATG